MKYVYSKKLWPMKKLLLIALGAAVVYACNPKVSEVVETTDTSETTENPMFDTPSEMSEDVVAGKAIFENKCTRCHDAKDIKSYTSEDWDKILPRMITKAKLLEPESTQVTSYVEWELNN